MQKLGGQKHQPAKSPIYWGNAIKLFRGLFPLSILCLLSLTSGSRRTKELNLKAEY